MSKFLDYFGKILMEQVRDEAISDWNMILEGKMKDSESLKIYKEIHSFNDEKFIFFLKKIISKVVDSSVYHLMRVLEEEANIKISVEINGEKISDLNSESDGLAGELYTEDGWFMRFSKEKYDED